MHTLVWYMMCTRAYIQCRPTCTSLVASAVVEQNRKCSRLTWWWYEFILSIWPPEVFLLPNNSSIETYSLLFSTQWPCTSGAAAIFIFCTVATASLRHDGMCYSMTCFWSSSAWFWRTVVSQPASQPNKLNIDSIPIMAFASFIMTILCSMYALYSVSSKIINILRPHTCSGGTRRGFQVETRFEIWLVVFEIWDSKRQQCHCELTDCFMQWFTSKQLSGDLLSFLSL